MKYKILETIVIKRTFEVEAESEFDAVDIFDHETYEPVTEKQTHYYEVEEIK